MAETTEKYDKFNVNGSVQNSAYLEKTGYNGSSMKSTTRTCERQSSGVKLRNYRKIIEQGNNATTPFNASEELYYPMSGRAYYSVSYPLPPKPHENRLAARSMTGTEVKAPTVSKTFSQIGAYSDVQANNEALANFISKATKAQTSFQGGTFLGELRETISLLRSPVKSLRHGLNTYLGAVKERSRRIRRLPRDRRKTQLTAVLSDTWLEYSFGWVPLIHDIDDGLKTLTDAMVDDYPPRKLVVGYGKTKIPTIASVWQFGVATPPYINYRTEQSSEVLVKYYGVVTVGTNSVTSARRIGFDPYSWAPTLWELIPYSFLVDYFTNIGDIVEAASFPRSTLKWVAKTVVKEEVARAVSPNPVLLTSGTASIRGSGSASTGVYWKKRVVSRDTYTGSLVPDLEFSLPGLGRKLLNIAALLNNSRRSSRQINRYLNG